PRIHQPADRRTGDADNRLPYAAAAPRREDAGAPPCLLRELSRDRRRRLFGGRRPAARLGRQGRVHGADLDFLRARQQRRPPGLPVQLQRRAGNEGPEPLPGSDQAVAAGSSWPIITSASLITTIRN